MASCHVTEVMKAVDVRRAVATNPVDQRQIMNSIAGRDEEEGLWVDASGKKHLTNTDVVEVDSGRAKGERVCTACCVLWCMKQISILPSGTD